MAEYIISGVWKNTDNVITHYAFHTIGATTINPKPCLPFLGTRRE